MSVVFELTDGQRAASVLQCPLLQTPEAGIEDKLMNPHVYPSDRLTFKKTKAVQTELLGCE